MLPSRHRLRQKRDVFRVLEDGRSRRDRFLSLKFIGNGYLFSRFGFLASKKIFCLASQRHRVKRKLREATRPILPLIKPGWDLILSARQGLGERKLSEVAEMIAHLLREANLTK